MTPDSRSISQSGRTETERVELVLVSERVQYVLYSGYDWSVDVGDRTEKDLMVVLLVIICTCNLYLYYGVWRRIRMGVSRAQSRRVLWILYGRELMLMLMDG